MGSPPSIPRGLLATFLGAAVLLPVVGAVLFWVGRLLTALGDAGGALAVERTMLGLGTLWIVDLVLLILALAVGSLGGRDDSAD